MSAHTPAPWNYGQVKETPIFDIIGPDLTGRGREVVGTLRATQSRVANLANARLISAAPDLLMALRFLLADYLAIEGEKLTGSSVPIAMAREAIAKAEGGAK
jgi:hypothetical protein